ncbi:MAG: J domain-containing protein [Pseudomonadota bacterium]
MSRRSIFDYDVSVSADKARRTRRRGMTGAFETRARRCEAPGCEAPAEYRAPRSPEELDSFRWFCLEHVREYNKRWNYFENWSEEALEEQLNADRVWDRPTWSFKGGDGKARENGHAEGRAWARFGYDDPFQVLGENATMNPGAREADPAREAPRRRLPPQERRALDILGMPDDSPKPDLRARYKELVKDLHPDMNGGRREEEDRLREVLWAWDQIKSSRRFPD